MLKLEGLIFLSEIVCYKTSWISYQIGKRLVNLKFISMVNLIMNKEVVTELVQNNFSFPKLSELDGRENRSISIIEYSDYKLFIKK